MDPETDLQAAALHAPVGQSTLSWRVAGPTQQQWMAMKDVFTQLYVGENRRLKDVRAILS